MAIGRYSSGSARSISSLLYVGRPYASLYEKLVAAIVQKKVECVVACGVVSLST